MLYAVLIVFFFQAEDGIRDKLVTGVQTCALPIFSVGKTATFHKDFSSLLFKTSKAPSPYCYRCPHNKAKAERTDARNSRNCNWECVDSIEKVFTSNRKKRPVTCLVVEPLVQGAAGIIPQPPGWLSKVSHIAKSHDAQIIADEVLTGFGRTGYLLASHAEHIQPDFLC